MENYDSNSDSNNPDTKHKVNNLVTALMVKKSVTNHFKPQTLSMSCDLCHNY